ncbi:MAG: endonuclease III [Candidatus Bipolaricaulis sp.]|nr:endonuclease III [Candidatus Bipolaricaulis sp.]
MDRAAHMAEVADRLRRRFGPVDHGDPEPPLDLLVRTILSQNTSDRNRDRAYAELRCRFPTWEDVLAAPPREVAGAIQGAGLHHQRAKRLHAVLARLRDERGTLTLDFLAQLPDEEAVQWLLSLPGVGKKTAYVVLLFGFGRSFFPVDTHISRVTKRLGLTDETGDPHDALAPLVPPGQERELHLHLIRLGREVCRPRQPRCPACPLRDVCPYGQKETR